MVISLVKLCGVGVLDANLNSETSVATGYGNVPFRSADRGTRRSYSMDTKNLIRKSKSHSPDARGRLLDTPLLGRKSVLMGMLTSGLVIAGAARPSAASAGTLKPAPLVATQPTTVPRWA